MKKLCLVVFAMVFTISVFAQLDKGTVYFKNGTIIKGKYQYHDGQLHIVSAGNFWIFDSSEVDSIASFRARKKVRLQEEASHVPVFYHVEAGLLAGNSQNNQKAPFSFTGSINYTINPNLSAGLGTGVEFFKESSLPLFLNLAYKVRNSFSTPYFFLKGGYQFPLDDSQTIYQDVYPAWRSSIWPGTVYDSNELDAKGGIMVNPGMGYALMFSPSLGMSLAFGYQFHRLHYKGEKDYSLDIDYNRLTIKIGILFN